MSFRRRMKRGNLRQKEGSNLSLKDMIDADSQSSKPNIKPLPTVIISSQQSDEEENTHSIHTLHNSSVTSSSMLSTKQSKADRKKLKKKKRLQQKMKRHLYEKASLQSTATATVAAPTTEYTAEYLEQLRKDTQATTDAAAKARLEHTETEEIIDITDATDSDGDATMKDDILSAKIAQARLQRRTNALISADGDERYGEHIGKDTGRLLDEMESDMQEDDQLEQFVAFGTKKKHTLNRLHSIKMNNSSSQLLMAKDNFQPNDAQRLISLAISELKDSRIRPLNAGHNISEQQIQTDLDMTNEEIRLAKLKFKQLDKKYGFYQELRDSNHALLNCLAEKSAKIQEYIELSEELREKRYKEWLVERCHLCMELYEYAFNPTQFHSDIQRIADTNTDTSIDTQTYTKLSGKKRRYEQMIATDSQLNNLSNVERVRQLRKHRRSVITDSYTPILNDTLFLQRKQIEKELSTIFEDTREEFHNFDHVQKKLEEWKARFPDDYRSAHVSLSVPKLVSSFVKQELIQWHPIDTSNDESSNDPLFVKSHWYSQMSTFGCDRNGDMDANDADNAVVPTLVAKLVIPALNIAIASDWDPFDQSQTTIIKTCIQCALDHVEFDKDYAPACNSIFDNITRKLEEIATLLWLDIPPQTVIDSSAVSEFKKWPQKPSDWVEPNQSSDIRDGSNPVRNVAGGNEYEFIYLCRIEPSLNLLLSLSQFIGYVSTALAESLFIQVYESVLNPFLTYVCRCPLRQAKTQMDAQLSLFEDFVTVMEALANIGSQWKNQRPMDDDDGNDNSGERGRLPVSVVKHILKLRQELTDNLSDSVLHSNEAVQLMQRLNACIF